MTAPPPPAPVRRPAHVLGIDIGGTKLAVGVADAAGTLLSTERIPSNSGESSERTLSRFIDACHIAIQKAAVTVDAAGVGCVGPLDQKTGHVINPVNLHGWRDVPLVDTLRDGLGIPVYLDNDANAAALGEHRFGAGRGVANMIYLTVSTGIGGGVIIDHRLYLGETGNAGELGHMSVDFNGRPCGCGNIGCIEVYASGTALAARAREAVAAGRPSLLLSLAGTMDRIDARTVEAAVRRADPIAEQIWTDAITALGAALASIIHTFNPRRIVIGGGVSQAGDLLFNPLRAATKKRAMPLLYAPCDIVPAQLGDQVGVLGAAAVGLDGYARLLHE